MSARIFAYPDEKIFVKKAEELTNYEGQPLSVVCAFHENPDRPFLLMESLTRNSSAERPL